MSGSRVETLSSRSSAGNDLDVIRDAGFDIDRQRNACTKKFEYRISANRGN